MKPKPTTKIANDLDDFPIPKPRLQGLGSWHTEVVPVRGGSVQVLHADGNWYCGKLTQYDELRGQWHILFDDGDHDWYSLPDRDVRLLRERARGSWATCLQTHQIRGQQQPVVSRDQQRDYFLAFQPSEAVPFRKPADVFAESPHLHNQNPGLPVPSETIWPGSSATITMAAAAETLRDDELFYGVRSNKRRRGPNQLPEQVKYFPEARAHTQLLELERRIDSAFSRRLLEAENDLKWPLTRPCRVQLCLFNTYAAQPANLHPDAADDNPMQIEGLVAGTVETSNQLNGHSSCAPCWTVCVSGRTMRDKLDDDPAVEEEESEDIGADFWNLFEEITFELPTDMYPRDSLARWVHGNPQPTKSGFCIRREGSRECIVRLRLRPRKIEGEEPRYLLSNSSLSSLIGFESGTIQEFLQAFWGYVETAGLVEDREVLFVRLDEALLRALNAAGNANGLAAGEGMLALTSVLSRLRSFLVEASSNVEIEYRLHLGGGSGGSGRSEPTVVEFEMPVLSHSTQQLRRFLDQSAQGTVGELAGQCAKLDSEIETKIDELEERRRKRAFLRGLADRPADALRRVADALTLDLETLRSDGAGPHCALSAEDARRSHIWQEPWVEEACLHYLWSQGYEVPLHLDASLLEEDAVAFECSTVIAANTAADRLTAAAKPLRPLSIAGPKLQPGHFFCERCQLRFETADALQTHVDFSAAHTEVTDAIRAAAWGPPEAATVVIPQARGQIQPDPPPSSHYTAQQVQQSRSTRAAPTVAGPLPPGQTYRILDQGVQNQAIWNQVQRDAKSRGLTVEQMREAYRERISRLGQGQNG